MSHGLVLVELKPAERIWHLGPDSNVDSCVMVMLTILDVGASLPTVPPNHLSSTVHGRSILFQVTPPTGEPDAGNPPSGSEGGGAEINRFSLPLSFAEATPKQFSPHFSPRRIPEPNFAAVVVLGATGFGLVVERGFCGRQASSAWSSVTQVREFLPRRRFGRLCERRAAHTANRSDGCGGRVVSLFRPVILRAWSVNRC